MKAVIWRRTTERGDTLVEVLIAMAIMSLVLVGAYVTSTRNSTVLQNSQEREQAQRLVEAQIEMLRANNGIAASGNCFSAGSETGTCNNFSAANSGATYTLTVVTPGGSFPASSPCGAASSNAYTICAIWTSLGSKADNDSNLTMYYKLN